MIAHPAPFATTGAAGGLLRAFDGEGRRADFGEGALGAGGAARLADLAAVRDEEVREVYPVGLWDESVEVALDLLGRLLLREPEARGEPRDVRVHDDARGDAEGVAEDDVGRLARDAGKLKQL